MASGIDIADLLVTVHADTTEQAQHVDRINKHTFRSSGFFREGIGTVLKFTTLAAAGFTIAKTAYEVVKAALDPFLDAGTRANQIQAQTNAVLRSMQGASGQTADSVARLANHITGLSGITRSTVQTGENMLLTFGNIGKQIFPAATQAVADLATKMAGGAVPSSEQMQASALQLGKALNDPVKGITALTRVGVSFNDAQKAQIRHLTALGDRVGAQKIILAEINKEFGGSAAALGSANGGAAVLSARLDSLKEDIGRALLVPIGAVTTALLPLVTVLSDALPGALAALGGVLAPVGATFQAIGDYARLFATEILHDIQPGLRAVGDAFAAIHGPSLNFHNVATQLTAIFAKVEPYVQTIARYANLLLVTLGPLYVKVIEAGAMLTALATPVGLVIFFGKDIARLLGETGDVLSALMPHIANLVSVIQTDIVPALQVVIPAVLSVAGVIRDALGASLSFILPVIGTVAGVLVDVLAVALRAIGAVVRAVAPVVVDLATRLGDALRPALANVSTTLSELYGWFNANVYPLIVRLVAYFNVTVAPVLSKLAGIIKDVLIAQLQAQWAFLSGTLLPILAKLADLVKNGIGAGFQAFGNSIKAVTSFLGRLFGWIGDILDKLAKIKDKIGDALGDAIHHLPGFASGGDVVDGGLARVGEDGPEVVALPQPIYTLGIRANRTSAEAVLAAIPDTQTIVLSTNGRDWGTATVEYDKSDPKLLRQIHAATR